MKWWKTTLLASLPLALVLTAAMRFIDHTDRKYSQSIAVYEASAIRLEARCAVLRTPAVCATAGKRRTFVVELESYRTRITWWRWPALITTLLAWTAVIASLVTAARESFRRPLE